LNAGLVNSPQWTRIPGTDLGPTPAPSESWAQHIDLRYEIVDGSSDWLGQGPPRRLDASHQSGFRISTENSDEIPGMPPRIPAPT
jgi:hypothetical protein